MDIGLRLTHPDFTNAFSAPVLRRIVARTAEESEKAVKEWYRALPEDWFDNPEPYPDGTSRRLKPRRFMRALTRHWYHEVTADGGFSLFFKSPREDGVPWGLRLQQYGGVVVPRRKRALTIPVTAEARGVSAADFEQATGRRLFLLKGEDLEPDEVGTLAYEGEDGRPHAAYKLRRRSEVPSLLARRGHNAMPDVYELRSMVLPRFADAVEMALRD
ncbi:MAG: hypothetical protein IKA55_08550 [Akkermansia sp.]|nr:hypothetical protein [Akkermansia sp.]